MSKTYDIVDNLGREFTYQLYANVAPSFSGDTSVSCTASATPGDLFASFTVVSLDVPADPLIQVLSLEFRNSGNLLTTFFARALSPSEQPPEKDFSYTETTIADPNGNYEIYKSGTTHTLIKDGVIISQADVGTNLFADSTVYSEAFPSSADITNIVLGS